MDYVIGFALGWLVMGLITGAIKFFTARNIAVKMESKEMSAEDMAEMIQEIRQVQKKLMATSLSADDLNRKLAELNVRVSNIESAYRSKAMLIVGEQIVTRITWEQMLIVILMWPLYI